MLPESEIIDRIGRGVSFSPFRVEVELYTPVRKTSRNWNSNLLGYDEQAWQQFLQRLNVDLILSVEWAGRKRYFVAEVKGNSTPRILEGAIQQARYYQNSLTRDRLLPTPANELGLLPMVIVPYLSEESLNRLIEAEVSGIDLSGNGIIIVSGEWFVFRTGAKNKYPSSTPIKNVYRGASSIVPRVLFMKEQFSSVTEVFEEIQKRGGGITLPTVSKALKSLQEELIVGRDEIIKLTQPGKLLDLLTENYRKPKILREVRGKADRPEQFFARETTTDGESRVAVFVACRSQTPYVLMPDTDVMSVYTTSIDFLTERRDIQESSRFPNVELLETDEPQVYFDRRVFGDKYFISPIQAYLELATGGKRERETAEQLRGDIVGFRYGY